MTAPLALGCNNFGQRVDDATSFAIVDAALEVGINTFDTADVYGGGGSEIALGKALAGRRNEATIISKFGVRRDHGDHGADASPSWARSSCDASLQRLGTDAIDVYMLHTADPATPIAETVDALAGLFKAGKVLSIAFSNLNASQIGEFVAAASAYPEIPVRGAQYEWSLLERTIEGSVLPELQHQGVGVMPYFPLASGMLSGKYRGGATPTGTRIANYASFERFASDSLRVQADALAELADEHGCTLLELAIQWVATRPGVDVVPIGASSPEQVRANAAAAGAEVPAEVLDAAATLTGETQP